MASSMTTGVVNYLNIQVLPGEDQISKVALFSLLKLQKSTYGSILHFLVKLLFEQITTITSTYLRIFNRLELSKSASIFNYYSIDQKFMSPLNFQFFILLDLTLSSVFLSFTFTASKQRHLEIISIRSCC